MTYRELCHLFANAGIPDAKGEARLLFCSLSGISPARLLADPGTAFADERLAALAAQRCEGTPLQYLLGEAYFYGERYRVSPQVLIPRPDTEILVEKAIRDLPVGVFADLCTGSGCVAISVLSHRPELTAHAFDISEGALEIARENAKDNGVEDRISFFKRDLLSEPLPQRYAGILSNPPYIPSSTVPTLSREVQKEPILALDGGEDGLIFYRHFLSTLRENLLPGGSFFFEIGYDQEEAILALGKEMGYRAFVLRDLSQNPRCAVLTPQ